MGIAKEQKNAKTQSRRRVSGGNSGPADWRNADPTILWETVSTVANNGGAIRFGYSRDGGAYAIGVYGDGDHPYTDYIRPGEDLNAYLQRLCANWEAGEVDEETLRNVLSPATRKANRD